MKKKDEKKQIKNKVEKTEIQKIHEQQERQALIFSPDTLLPQKDADKELEKFFLLSNVETSWKELKEAHLKYNRFINAKLRDWELTFEEELYRQWRKLNGWPMNSKSRPMIFAAYTVRDIYGSLPKEIYETLDTLNEYIYPGIRKYRYCRLLTKECHEKVREIIKSAIGFATSSTDMYQYRLKLAAKYGTPFSKSVCQMDAFRDNDDILGTT